MKSPKYEFLDLKLDDTQRRALHLIETSIVSVAKRIPELHELQPEIGRLQNYFNIFAILGPRGAGKSTLLYQLYQRIIEGKSQLLTKPEIQNAERGLLVLPPLDCSALPGEIGPGAAVLMHMLTTFEKGLVPDGRAIDEQEELGKLRHKVDELVGLYSRIGSRFQDLCLDLSSSPGDYGDYIANGLRDRLGLNQRLNEWLGKTLNSRGFDAVVVLLDDFDLIPAEEVQAWLQAFQDELHQLRMLFVLTADLYRLEYLSWDAEKQVDDKTGRAILGKILAPQNRVVLEEWWEISRRFFRANSGKPLCQLLEDDDEVPRSLQPLLFRLLPRWPRGLSNLYQSLDRLRDEMHKNETADHHLRQLLSELATSRAEPLLARQLREVDLAAWVGRLRFEEGPLSREDWQVTVDAAWRRLAARKEVSDEGGMKNLERVELQPLKGLVPTPSRDDLRMITPPRSTDGESRLLATVDTAEWWQLDPSWQDPLRHDRLRMMPLRDVMEAERELWSELLVNFGLLHSPSERLRFLYQWRPAAGLLAECRFRIAFSRRYLRLFFEDNAGILGPEPLAWLRWKRGGDAGESEHVPVLEIGWAPMAEILREARDPLSSDLLADLLVDVSSLGRGRDINNSLTCEPGELIPGDVASLVLFTDALSRCPWMPLSTALGWELTTHIGFSAAFVRTAYVAALCKGGILERGNLSERQQQMLDVVERRDATPLLRYHEESLLISLHELFEDGFESEFVGRTEALSEAMRAYLACPYYTSVRQLLSKQPEVLAAKDN